MNIREMEKELRPREKASVLGLESLTDTELLALVLRSGYKGKSVFSLANEILDLYPLSELSTITLEQLMSIKGIKLAKAMDLMACFELSKRSNLAKSKQEDVINNPEALHDFIKSEIGSLENEHFLVVCLNTKNIIIDYKILFIGTVDMAIVHPRDVFKFAIKNNATSIICAHNHPSSDTTPSRQDLKITKILQDAGDLIGIRLVDHLIVSNSEVYSILKSV